MGLTIHYSFRLRSKSVEKVTTLPQEPGSFKLAKPLRRCVPLCRHHFRQFS